MDIVLLRRVVVCHVPKSLFISYNECCTITKATLPSFLPFVLAFVPLFMQPLFFQHASPKFLLTLSASFSNHSFVSFPSEILGSSSHLRPSATDDRATSSHVSRPSRDEGTHAALPVRVAVFCDLGCRMSQHGIPQVAPLPGIKTLATIASSPLSLFFLLQLDKAFPDSLHNRLACDSIPIHCKQLALSGWGTLL